MAKWIQFIYLPNPNTKTKRWMVLTKSMTRKDYRLCITTFDLVDGIYFYGSIYHCGAKVHEVSAPRPYTSIADGQTYMIDSIKFDSIPDLVKAATEWFLTSPDVRPGARLIGWRDEIESPAKG